MTTESTPPAPKPITGAATPKISEVQSPTPSFWRSVLQNSLIAVVTALVTATIFAIPVGKGLIYIIDRFTPPPAVSVGTIQMFAGPEQEIPEGWAPCLGQTMSSVTYRKLYAIVGQFWGVGDGSKDTNGNICDFNLPDLRGRFARGVDDDSHNDPDAGMRKLARGGW